MSRASAIQAMDEGGRLSAVVPVPIRALLDSRVHENEESGEDYAVVTRMIKEFVGPVQTS